GYGFAMPETSIGFFPDVGATWLLSHLPDRFGIYLGLSGRTIGRGDALQLGLATHCIPAARFEDIREALALAEPVDPLLDNMAEHVSTETRDAERNAIRTCFSANSVGQILDRLKSTEGEQAGWASALLEELHQKSPTSLAVTLWQLTRDMPPELRTCLIREYRQACRFLEAHDLHEGIRALLIDKDKNPVWNPARVTEVDARTVEAYFEPPPSGDLELPPRPKAVAAID
ncbi:MAG: enoyl-CoA hydratase/isomerase family protein, partial [Hyphomicrobiaceae bacterium]